MLEVVKEHGNQKLMYDNREIFSHSSLSPFITVSTGNLKFSDKRGSFNVRENVSGVIPLENIDVLDDKDNLKISFSSGDVKINIDFEESDGVLIMKLSNEGNFDKVSFNFTGYYDEKIFGLGERFRRLNNKGRKIYNLVSEHISLKPIIKKSIAPFKWFPNKPLDEVKTYAPMTTFVSSKGYSIKVDVTGYGEEEFLFDKSVLSYWELPKSIKFTAGTFREISERFNNARPYLPDWVNDGMILGIQGGIDYAMKQAFKMQDKGAKISGVWCQDWSGKKITVAGKQVYWNWEVSDEMYGNLKENIAEMKKRGIRFLSYINPYLLEGSKMFNYCKEKDYLIKNSDGGVYLFKTTTFPAGMMDLTNSEMVKYLKDTIIKKNMIDLGISGWMADFGEYLPEGVILRNKVPSAKMHNIWTTLWAKINREAIEEAGAQDEVFFFTRSAYNGAEHYSPIMWNGDQHTDYSLDYGMPCVIPASVNLGLSGMPLVHSDIGGYITFKALKRDSELFIRWMSMNCFTPMMRTHETTRPEENAQYDTEDVIKYSVLFSNIHSMLKPYIKKVIEEAKQGIPAIRASFYNYNNIDVYREDYVFMFGGDIFVAPVIEKGAGSRNLTLPADNWVNIFTGMNNKGGNISAKAPFNAPPVYYRADSEYKELFKSITEYCKKTKI